MAVEVDDLYLNLNQLLNDICKFLTDEATYQTLSVYARKHADELISRSKQQLTEITKLTTYVDMDPIKESVYEEDDKNNIYSSVEEIPVITPPVVVQSPPYLELPAKALTQSVKFGHLIWRYKIKILNYEKKRRIYAGVYDDWLLVYNNEKDMKPFQSFHLKHHKAEEVASKQTKNLPQLFQLVCTAGDSTGKIYSFEANTHKDMLQWKAHINHCYENLNKNSDAESENIYMDLPQSAVDLKKNLHIIKPPDLPIRQLVKPFLPLPTPPQQNDANSQNSSNSSIYEVVSRNELDENEGSINSFSEEEEEVDYQCFVNNENKAQVSSINKRKMQEEPPKTSVVVEKPTVLGKPTVLEKPKISAAKLKYLAALKK